MMKILDHQRLIQLLLHFDKVNDLVHSHKDAISCMSSALKFKTNYLAMYV